jgi:hypothetical protein
MQQRRTRRHVIFALIALIAVFAGIAGTVTLRSILADTPPPVAPITTTSHTTAQGFDICQAPPLDTMAAWWQHSPYRWMNIYIGGLNRACPNGPSAQWVAAAYQMGWGLVPTYVGLQAPASCADLSTHPGTMSIDPATAQGQGAAEATDAANSAKLAALYPGTIVYFDMEWYSPSGCAQAVNAFISGWDAGLHKAGYKAGVYISGSNIGALVVAPGVVQPDDVWITNSGFASPTGGYMAGCSVYGNTQVSDAAWHGRRLYQYLVNNGLTLSHSETWGGVTLPSIDSDCADGDVVGHAGPLALAPAYSQLAANQDGRLEAFARATDNNIWRATQATPGGPWLGWQPMQAGFSFISDPVVGQEKDGRLIVLAIGIDGAIWANVQTAPNKTWAGWHPVPMPEVKGLLFTGTSAVARNLDDTIEIFALGNDGAIWNNRQTATGTWTGWQTIQSDATAPPDSATTLPSFTGVPVVTQDGDGRLEVFALGKDGGIWLMFQQVPNGSWYGWLPLQSKAPAPFVGTPAALRDAAGKLELFARDAQGNAWHNQQTTQGGAWAGWTPLTQGVAATSNTATSNVAALATMQLTSDPVIGQDHDGRLEIFALGADSNLWVNFQLTVGGTWYGWLPLQGALAFAGTPSVTRDTSGRLSVIALTTAGVMMSNTQRKPGGTWNAWVPTTSTTPLVP